MHPLPNPRPRRGGGIRGEGADNSNMLFNSQVFIFGFLPLVLARYYALRGASRGATGGRRARVARFYGWWDVRFVPLLVGLTIANWLIAQWFGAARARWIPVLGVVLNLAVLGLFKYADFFRGTVFGCWANRGSRGT